MWARRLSHRLMMAGPLVLVSAIAINARSGTPYENRAEFGAENHKRLLAYVGPIRAAESLMRSTAEGRRANTDRVVQLWLGLSDAKSLLPIMPVDFDTSPQETVLNDIKGAKLTLLFILQDRAALCHKAK